MKSLLQRYSGKQALPQSSSTFYHHDTTAGWTYCKSCNQVLPRKMIQTFGKKSVIKTSNVCTCKAKKCVHPKYKDIPKELRGLSLRQIVALRPLNIHCGDYDKNAKGYRKKRGMFCVSWSTESPMIGIRLCQPMVRFPMCA